MKPPIRLRPRHTIEVFRDGHQYHARYSHPRVLSTHGRDTLPLRLGPDADPLAVLAEIQQSYPEANVFLCLATATSKRHTTARTEFRAIPSMS